MAKIGIIADIHNSEEDAIVSGIWGVNDMRHYTNAPTRAAAFKTYMDAQGDIDFRVDLGDIVNVGAADPAVELAEIVAALGADHLVMGNHEIGIWGATGLDDWTDYEAVVSQTPPDEVGHWTIGKPANYPNTTAYSFDTAGLHCVTLAGAGASLWSEAERAAFITWLAADLAATSLPIIILTHCHLDNSANIGLARYIDYETVQTEIEKHNIQAVISGHLHTIPENPCTMENQLRPFLYKKAEIPYFHLRGNLLGHTSIETEPIATDAAYYIFDINPNAVQGRNRMKANIEVWTNFVPQDAIMNSVMDKNLDTYLPVVA